MKAIDFVVRDSAGGLQRGVVPSEAPSHTIQAGAGQEISLNLRQIDLQVQQRVGDDLVITLVDGREITIDNFFNGAGTPNRLFVSADGYLNEVSFVDAGSGELYAQFGPTEQWGKWSPSDDLIYLGRTELAVAGVADDEVSMFAAPLLGAGLLGGGGAIAAGAAALGGAALVASGGRGEGEVISPGTPTDPTPTDPDPTPTTPVTPVTPGPVPVTPPFVNDPDNSSSIGGDDVTAPSVTVTGGGVPGDAVMVVIGGKVVRTVIGENGTFEATFSGENFPPDGSYEAVVTVTTTGGDVVLDGPAYVIDTTPPAIEVTSGTGSVQDFFNAASFSNGVTLTGKGEPGASLLVTIAGVEQSTTVGSDGSWSVSWASGTLQGGEYTTGVTIVSADSFGNTTTITDTLVVDTVSAVTVETNNIEGDGTINAEELKDGVTLTGTAQAGSSVEVSFGSGKHVTTADANGNWSADFAMSEIPSGEVQAPVTAVATDAFGNASTATGMVDIDTLVRDFGFTSTTGGADGVINIEEAASGLVMTGMVEPGSKVMVNFGTATREATVGVDGSWTVSFASNEIPSGTQTAVMTAEATDAAGNKATITRDVAIDRDAGILTISDAPVETDDVISQAEARDGVVLTGTSNANAVVNVSLGGVVKTVVADGAGNWQAGYTNAEVTPGVYTADIVATTVDPAGNKLEATDSVRVDTRVDNLSVNADTVGHDGMVSGAERLADGGVVVTGTTEIGSNSVLVTLNGVQVPATIASNGTWSASFAPNQVSEGTYTAALTVEAQDQYGNTGTVSGTVQVDTEVTPLNMNDEAGGRDQTVNIGEAATGIDLGGKVEIGSTVAVNYDGKPYVADVDAAGNWSVTIPPADIRVGAYDAVIAVTATDPVGNVDTLSETLAIDTSVPEGPVVVSYTRAGDGIRGISTEQNEDDLSVYEVREGGAITEVGTASNDNPFRDETDFAFSADVPDGSHLVVTAMDAAGNTAGTYLVLDDETVSSNVTVDNPALGNYNIETVDLSFAEEAHLTVDEAALLALSSNTNEVQILGGADDTLTIRGAVARGAIARDGEIYDIYTMGSEGTILVDDDINVNT